MLSISIRDMDMDILRIIGKEQAIPRTHIHSCPSSLLKISRVQANKVFFSSRFVFVLFYFCGYKERTNNLLFISKGNLLKSLKRIIKLNFYTWKTTSQLYFKSSRCIPTHQQVSMSATEGRNGTSKHHLQSPKPS